MPTLRKPARASTRKIPIGPMTAKSSKHVFRKQGIVPKFSFPSESLLVGHIGMK